MNPTEATPAEQLLSLEEFALAIGRSVRTVSRYVRQGRILTVPVNEQGRSVLRIPEAEIYKTVDVHDRQPAPDGRRRGRHMTDSDEHDLTDVRHVADTEAEVLSDGRHVADTETDVLSDGGHVADTIETVLSDGRQVSATWQTDGRHVADTVSASPGFISAADVLARYEIATVRLGWLEGQLEMTRRMLTDGGAREAELLAQTEAERQARVKAEAEAAGLAEARQRAEEAERRERQLADELAAARARLEQLELEQHQPWWKKLFAGGR